MTDAEKGTVAGDSDGYQRDTRLSPAMELGAALPKNGENDQDDDGRPKKNKQEDQISPEVVGHASKL